MGKIAGFVIVRELLRLRSECCIQRSADATLRILYSEFQNFCDDEVKSDNLTMSPGHDETAATIFQTDSGDLNDCPVPGILTELLETGSVTVHVKGRKFILSIQVKEVES